MIGIPKFPSQPNNGVRRNFDAILSISQISLTNNNYSLSISSFNSATYNYE
jgi:hypothetical protein